MSSKYAVELTSVTKIYSPYVGPLRLKSVLDRIKNAQIFDKLVEKSEFKALNEVSFKISPGEKIGVMGHNGAGKSTLLRLISGISAPTSGTVQVNGTISSVLNMGAGFHTDLSGRDNIYMQGAMYGFSKEKIDSLVPSVVAISELDRFIDTPLKHYSSGMRVRLGFALAMTTRPDVALLDEVLAVGDRSFKEKSGDLMQQYLEGKTLIFVSHGLNEIKRVCNRALVMDRGRLAFDGPVEHALDFYKELGDRLDRQPEISLVPGKVKHGFSTQPAVTIQSLDVSPDSDRINGQIMLKGEVGSTNRISIELTLILAKQDPKTKLSQRIFSKTTDPIDAQETLSFSLSRSELAPGQYRLEAFIREVGAPPRTARSAASSGFVLSPEQHPSSNLLDLDFRFL